MSYDQKTVQSYIEKMFHESVVPSLSEFIAIPNLSRLFDPSYATNGLLRKAAEHLQKWAESLSIEGLKTEIIQSQGLTPLLFIQIEGTIKDHTILFYGHFDKQPHMTGWDQNKGPTKPVIENNRLYGRGASDDGYNLYSSILAVKSVQQQGIPLPKIFMVIEGDQQSGSHIQNYLQLLRDRLGNLDVIFCLDSDCYDYDRLWITKSLRGVISFLLNVKTLTEGVHSGDSSGIVPSVFKVFNILISRLQDLQTGRVHQFFNVDIPAERYEEAYQRVKLLGDKTFNDIGTIKGLSLMSQSNVELLLNRSWKPQLTVTGINGIPPIHSAGNVMVPEMTFKVSLRVPPTFNCTKGVTFIQDLLTTNVPFGAKVTLSEFDHGEGWNAPSYQPWLEAAIQKSSEDIFGLSAVSLHEGGSIPVINSIAKFWPTSQMIITGVLGPNSGAHGPNEYLDIPYAIKLTRSVSQLLSLSSQHWKQQAKQ